MGLGWQRRASGQRVPGPGERDVGGSRRNPQLHRVLGAEGQLAESSQCESLTHVQLCATPRALAHQAPLSMGSSRKEHWSGFPFPSPGDLPTSGIEPGSPALQADSLPSEPPGKPLGVLKGPVGRPRSPTTSAGSPSRPARPRLGPGVRGAPGAGGGIQLRNWPPLSEGRAGSAQQTARPAASAIND